MKIFIYLFLCVLFFFPHTNTFAQTKEAELLLKQKQYRKALELVRPELASRATKEILNIAARACLGLHKADSAYDFAQRSMEEKESPEALLLLTRSARESNHIDVALPTAHKLVKVDSKNSVAMAEAGATAVLADSLYLATRWLIAARELNPNEPTVHEYLGDVYFKQTVYELAKGEYLDALRLDSLNIDPRWKLARVAIKQKQVNEALNEYRKIYQIDSTEIEALLEIANLYYANAMYTSAAPFYLKYIQKSPENVKARILAARTLAALKQYNQVIEILKPVEKDQQQNVDLLRSISEAYYKMGQSENASAYYEKVVATGKGTSEDYQQLGTSYAREKKYSEATASLLKAIELDSLNGEAHFELGSVYYKNGDFETALKYYRVRSSLDTSNYSVMLNIGYAEYQLKRYDSAVTSFSRVAQLKPDLMQAYLWLGRCFAIKDTLEAEEVSYQRVLDLTAQDTVKYGQERGEAYRSLGYIKAKQNNYTAALELLKLSIKADDKVAATYVLLGQVFAQLGKKKEAIDAFKKALKLDPKNIDAKKGIQILSQPTPPKPPK